MAVATHDATAIHAARSPSSSSAGQEATPILQLQRSLPRTGLESRLPPETDDEDATTLDANDTLAGLARVQVQVSKVRSEKGLGGVCGLRWVLLRGR